MNPRTATAAHIVADAARRDAAAHGDKRWPLHATVAFTVVFNVVAWSAIVAGILAIF
jgi:hypothetical protein